MLIAHRRQFRIIVLVLGFINALFAQQHRVDPRNMYHRVIAIVPLVGQGTPDDPKRPQYAPLTLMPGARTGIIAFTHRITDDGNHAIVEFVGADRAAFRELLADQRPDVVVFERGRHSREEIEAEVHKYLKNFTLAGFGTAVR